MNGKVSRLLRQCSEHASEAFLIQLGIDKDLVISNPSKGLKSLYKSLQRPKRHEFLEKVKNYK